MFLIYASELNEQKIYHQLLALSPGLEQKLGNGTEEDIFYASDMVRTSSPLYASGILNEPTDHKRIVTSPIRRH